MSHVLLIGAGRMGLRHLRGLARDVARITLVYNRRNVDEDVNAVLEEESHSGDLTLLSWTGINDLAGEVFDAAILSATAEDRCVRFDSLAGWNIPHILVEKPIEQSRAALHHMKAAAERISTDVRCNHIYREQAVFDDFRTSPDPINMTVNSGAIGLGCVGIHWLDPMLDLTNGAAGRLVEGRLDPVHQMPGLNT